MPIRVYELARKMGKPIKSRILIDAAKELGFTNVKAPNSNLTEGQADRLRDKVLHQLELEKKKKTDEQKKPVEPETDTTVEKPAEEPELKKDSTRNRAAVSTARMRTRTKSASVRTRLRARSATRKPRMRKSDSAETKPAETSAGETSEPVPAIALETNEPPAPPETTRETTEQPTTSSEPAPEPTIDDAAAALESPASEQETVSADAPEIDVKTPVEPSDTPLAEADEEAVASGATTADQENGSVPFGVVATAQVAQEIYGPVPVRKKKGKDKKQKSQDKTVESKIARDTEFEPEVSYPSLHIIRRRANKGETDEDRPRRGRRREKNRERPQQSQQKMKNTAGSTAVIAPPKHEGPVDIYLPATLRGLSESLGIKMGELQKKLLLEEGKMIGINEILPEEEIEAIALEFDMEVLLHRRTAASDELEQLEKKYEAIPAENRQPRPPIVTVLGHVDHGKTSLLDYIRKAHVAVGEAGGITQAIGAYQLRKGDLKVTFIDTPGHEAFTEMRARGANVTDIAVLIVAADDGVMPQTREAIGHAKAAGVKIIVAITKIDLPSADIMRVKSQLAEEGLTPVEWDPENGVEMLEISSVTGQGIDDLVETLAMETEILDLRAVIDMPATGYVLEAHRDEGRGITSTFLVKHGILRKGDIVVAGHSYGRIKQMYDDLGHEMTEALPSMPVEVLGLDNVPNAGQKFFGLADIKLAASIAAEYKRLVREEEIMARSVGFKDIFQKLAQQEIKDLNIVLKADVRGSLEPIRRSLMDLNTDEVRVRILYEGVGPINGSDVMLAHASSGMIIGFNVIADQKARAYAEADGITIRTYNVIYEVVGDIRARLGGMLSPIIEKTVTATLEVRQVFKLSRIGVVAGCFVVSGSIQRGNHLRLSRDGVIIWPHGGDTDGDMVSLKRFKEDVREVREGFECGVKLKDFNDIKVGDIIESYSIEKTIRTLDEATKV